MKTRLEVCRSQRSLSAGIQIVAAVALAATVLSAPAAIAAPAKSTAPAGKTRTIPNPQPLTPNLNSPAAPSFKNFKGPKPGEWKMSATITIPGSNQKMNQETVACVKPGEDLKQRALGQMGDSARGCVISITKDTEAAGSLTTKCPNVSASVDIVRVSDNEYKFNVDSSMAKVFTVNKFVGTKCLPPKPTGPTGGKPQSACEGCKSAVVMVREQCAKLSDASRGNCEKSAKTISDQCAAQCKAKK